MPEKGEKDSAKMLKKLENLEDKLDKVEKESKLSGEDQLFFGLIIALVILFLTLPTEDISNLFSSLNSVAAEYSATAVKYMGLAFFVGASVTRYYAALKESPISEKFRYFSLEALIGGFDSIITVFILNAIGLAIPFASAQIFSPVESATFVSVLVFALLTAVLVLMSIFEGRILKLYKANNIISNDYQPLVTKFFSSISFSLDIGFLSEIFWIHGFSQNYSEWLFRIVGIITFLILFCLFIIRKIIKKAD